jgi:hypothetical protein
MSGLVHGSSCSSHRPCSEVHKRQVKDISPEHPGTVALHSCSPNIPRWCPILTGSMATSFDMSHVRVTGHDEGVMLGMHAYMQ